MASGSASIAAVRSACSPSPASNAARALSIASRRRSRFSARQLPPWRGPARVAPQRVRRRPRPSAPQRNRGAGSSLRGLSSRCFEGAPDGSPTRPSSVGRPGFSLAPSTRRVFRTTPGLAIARRSRPDRRSPSPRPDEKDCCPRPTPPAQSSSTGPRSLDRRSQARCARSSTSWPFERLVLRHQIAPDQAHPPAEHGMSL